MYKRQILKELAAYAGQFERQPIPVSELVVGMKCGGSDGLSGITANPTIGRFSDMMGQRGGSTVLTEVPEICLLYTSSTALPIRVWSS